MGWTAFTAHHGGRQANGGLPALDCLLAVVEVADGLPVLFDSGIRGGADIIKALALGATAVGIGWPYAYGLALGGVAGASAQRPRPVQPDVRGARPPKAAALYT